jgi:hypothetical protein
MQKILWALMALLLTVLPASAQLTNLPQNFGYQFRSPSKFTRGLYFSLSPQTVAIATATGTMYRLAAPATSATGGAVVTTYTLPANSLTVTPEGLKVRVHAVCAANANAKNVVFNFGGQNITLLNTTANATDVYADIEIYRTGLNTQRVTVAGYANGALLNNLSVNGTQTETAAIAMSVTMGTAVANSDVTLDGYSIYGESN